MRRLTKELEEAVAPAILDDVLDSLLMNGMIESYIIDGDITTITVAKDVEIAELIKEESRDVENVRSPKKV